jgi:hypothetical protein
MRDALKNESQKDMPSSWNTSRPQIQSCMSSIMLAMSLQVWLTSNQGKGPPPLTHPIETMTVKSSIAAEASPSYKSHSAHSGRSETTGQLTYSASGLPTFKTKYQPLHVTCNVMMTI